MCGDGDDCVLGKVVRDEGGTYEQSSATGVPETSSGCRETCVCVVLFARFGVRNVEEEESERLADFDESSSFTLLFSTALEDLDERVNFALRHRVILLPCDEKSNQLVAVSVGRHFFFHPGVQANSW